MTRTTRPDGPTRIFAGTRSRSSSTSATRQRPERRWSGSAATPGPRRSTTSTTRRSDARLGEPTRRTRCGPVLRRSGRPGAGAGRADALGGAPGRVPRPARAPPAERVASRARSATSRRRRCAVDRGRAAGPGHQPGRRRVACGPSAAFVEEEVIRWLCDLVGYGEGSFGLLTSGGVMANFMAMALARDVRLRELRGPGPAAPRCGAGGRPRLRLRPGPLLGGAGARRAGLPARRRSSRCPPTSASGSRPGRSRPPSPRTARRATRRSPSWPPRAPRTPAPSTMSPAIADIAEREACGSTSTPPTVARRASRERAAPLVPGLELADSVTIDPHKWFFQAYDIGGLLVREAACWRTRSRIGPSTTAAAATPPRARRARQRLARLLPAGHRGHAALARAQAVDVLEAPRHARPGPARGGERRHGEAWPSAIAASHDFEQLPARPELSVVCFRHLPAGRAAGTG